MEKYCFKPFTSNCCQLLPSPAQLQPAPAPPGISSPPNTRVLAAKIFITYFSGPKLCHAHAPLWRELINSGRKRVKKLKWYSYFYVFTYTAIFLFLEAQGGSSNQWRSKIVFDINKDFSSRLDCRDVGGCKTKGRVARWGLDARADPTQGTAEKGDFSGFYRTIT